MLTQHKRSSIVENILVHHSTNSFSEWCHYLRHRPDLRSNSLITPSAQPVAQRESYNNTTRNLNITMNSRKHWNSLFCCQLRLCGFWILTWSLSWVCHRWNQPLKGLIQGKSKINEIWKLFWLQTSSAL